MAKEMLVLNYLDCNDYYCRIWYLPEENKFKMVDLREHVTPLGGWYADAVTHYYTAKELADDLWEGSKYLRRTFIDSVNYQNLPAVKAVCAELEMRTKNDPQHEGLEQYFKTIVL